MLNRLAFTELACRASNLSERAANVIELKKRVERRSFSRKLSSLDMWILDKLVAKLRTLQLKQEIYNQTTDDLSERPNLQQLLTDYRLYELNLSELSEAEQDIFLQQHETWLKTYRSALETVDLESVHFTSVYWNDRSIYYGRFAKVCEPFLRLIQQKLQVKFSEIKRSECEFTISKQVITDIQLELLNRFEITLARAVEADIRLYCYQNNIAPSTSSKEYIEYIDRSFYNDVSYHKFFCKFPTLGRWLATVTGFFCEFGEELIERLTTNRAEIADTFFRELSISRIKSVKLGESDPHLGSRSVAIIDVECTNSEQLVKREKIVYKPRCLKSEAAFQGLLETLSNAGVVQFPIYKTICKEGYGYVEFLPVKNNAEGEKARENASKFSGQKSAFMVSRNFTSPYLTKN